MDFARAYDLLHERWPRRTFAISRDVWHHDHSDSVGGESRTDEYSIWDARTRVHYYGPTLEAAMEQALGCDADVLAGRR